MCDIEDLCLDAIDGWWAGVVFEAILLIYSLVGIAQVADAHLVPGLETLCHRWNIPGHVAGASFLALGSSAPEVSARWVGVGSRVRSPGDTAFQAALVHVTLRIPPTTAQLPPH
jgi:Ca2+/H+ antiporter